MQASSFMEYRECQGKFRMIGGVSFANTHGDNKCGAMQFNQVLSNSGKLSSLTRACLSF